MKIYFSHFQGCFTVKNYDKSTKGWRLQFYYPEFYFKKVDVFISFATRLRCMVFKERKCYGFGFELFGFGFGWDLEK